ncbi:MAG: DUF2892 domain-containing protein [Nanoarchaeota archaeon]
MCKNVGRWDSFARILVGVVVLVIGALYQSWWGALGLIPLLTGLFMYCPIYSLFKWNTGGTCECCCEAPKAKPIIKKKKK